MEPLLVSLSATNPGSVASYALPRKNPLRTKALGLSACVHAQAGAIITPIHE
jgi:hypothetical protein